MMSLESSDENVPKESGISAFAKKVDAETKQDATENDTGAKPSAKKSEEVRDARSPSGKKDTRTENLESSAENSGKEGGISAFAKKLDAKTNENATKDDAGAKPSAKKTEEVRDARSPSGKKDTRTASLESSDENVPKEGGISAFAKKLDAKTKQDATKDDAGAKPSAKKTEEVPDTRSPSSKKDARTTNLASGKENFAEGISTVAKILDAKFKEDATKADAPMKITMKKSEEMRDARGPSAKNDENSVNVEGSEEQAITKWASSASVKQGANSEDIPFSEKCPFFSMVEGCGSVREGSLVGSDGCVLRDYVRDRASHIISHVRGDWFDHDLPLNSCIGLPSLSSHEETTYVLHCGPGIGKDYQLRVDEYRPNSEDTGPAKKEQKRKPKGQVCVTESTPKNDAIEGQLGDDDTICSAKQEDVGPTAKKIFPSSKDRTPPRESSTENEKGKSQRSREFPIPSTAFSATVEGQLTDGNETGDCRKEDVRATRKSATKPNDDLIHSDSSMRNTKGESQRVQEVSATSMAFSKAGKEHLVATDYNGTFVTCKNEDVGSPAKKLSYRSGGRTPPSDELYKNQKGKTQQDQGTSASSTFASGSLKGQIQAVDHNETLSIRKKDSLKKDRKEKSQQNQDILTSATVFGEAVKEHLVTTNDSKTVAVKKEGSTTEKFALKTKNQTAADKLRKTDNEEEEHQTRAIFTAPTIVNEAITEQKTDDNGTLSATDENSLKRDPEEQQSQEFSTALSADFEVVEKQVISRNETKNNEAIAAMKQDGGLAPKNRALKSKDENLCNKLQRNSQEEQSHQGQEVFTTSTAISESVTQQVVHDHEISDTTQKLNLKLKGQDLSGKLPRKEQQEIARQCDNVPATVEYGAIEDQLGKAGHCEELSAKNEDVGPVAKNHVHKSKDGTPDKSSSTVKKDKTQRRHGPPTQSSVVNEALTDELLTANDSETLHAREEDVESEAMEPVPSLEKQAARDKSRKVQNEKSQVSQEFSKPSTVVSEALEEKTTDNMETSDARNGDDGLAPVKLAFELQDQIFSHTFSRKDQEVTLHHSSAVSATSTLVYGTVGEHVVNDSEKCDNLPRENQGQKLQQSEEALPASTVVTEAMEDLVINDNEAKKEDVSSAAKKFASKSRSGRSSNDSSNKDQKEESQHSHEALTLSTFLSKAIKEQLVDENETTTTENKDMKSPAKNTAAESKQNHPTHNWTMKKNQARNTQSQEFSKAELVVSETVKEQVIQEKEACEIREGEVGLETKRISYKLQKKERKKRSSSKTPRENLKEESPESHKVITATTSVIGATEDTFVLADDNEIDTPIKEDFGALVRNTNAKSILGNLSDILPCKDKEEELQHSLEVFTPSMGESEVAELDKIDDNETSDTRNEIVGSAAEKPAPKSGGQTAPSDLSQKHQFLKLQNSKEAFPASTEVTTKEQAIDSNKTKKEDKVPAAKRFAPNSRSQNSGDLSKNQEERLQQSQEVSTRSTFVSEAVRKQVIDGNETSSAEKRDVGSFARKSSSQLNDKNLSGKLARKEQAEKFHSHEVFEARTVVTEDAKKQVDGSKARDTMNEDVDPAAKSIATEPMRRTCGYSSKGEQKEKPHQNQEVPPISAVVSEFVEEELEATEANCAMKESVELAVLKPPANLTDRTASASLSNFAINTDMKQLGDDGEGRATCYEHVESEESEIEFSKFNVSHSSGAPLGTYGLAEDEASVGCCFPIPLTVRVELKVASFTDKAAESDSTSIHTSERKRDNKNSNVFEDPYAKGAKLKTGSELSSPAQREPLSRKHFKTKPKSYISKETEKLLRKKAKAKQNSSLTIDNVASDNAPTDDLFALCSKKECDEFGNQSTDPMTDQTNDSDFAMERSEQEINTGGGAKLTTAGEHPRSRQNIAGSSKSALITDQNLGIACAPSFLQKRQTVKCTEGKSLAVNVFLVASPPPAISVYHNNDHVICANQVEPVDTPEHNLYSFTFTINRVRFEDSGKLMFQAANLHGFDECTAYLEIADEVKPKFSKYDTNTLFEREFEAAEIIWSVTDVTVAEGGTAWLYGKLCGFPAPELIWLKNGEEIRFENSEGKYRPELKNDGTFALEIANCTHDDEDVYELLVENMAGVDSCLFKISIENSGEENEKQRRKKHILRPVSHHKNDFSSDSEMENKTKKIRRRMRKVTERSNPSAPRLTQMIAPRFNKALDDQDVATGEQVVMMVATQGNPPPSVHFYRDGKLLSNNEKYEIRHEGETLSQKHYLIVRNTEQSEEAEYACQAVNPAGETWCYSDVLVRPSLGNTDETEVTPLDGTSLSLFITDAPNDVEKNEVEQVTKENECTQNSALHTEIFKASKMDQEKKRYKVRKTKGTEGELRGKDDRLHREVKEILVSPSSIHTEENSLPFLIQEDGRVPRESISKEDENNKLPSQIQSVTEDQTVKETEKAEQQHTKGKKKDANIEESEADETSLLDNVVKESATSDTASTEASTSEPPPRPPKKKKNVPKALVIPYEINSLFGDPSILRSEANITAKIKAPEGTAEATSPVKEPRSASISAKVGSVCKSFSRSGTPREVAAEFIFEKAPQSHTQEICILQKMPNNLEDEQDVIEYHSVAVVRGEDVQEEQPGTDDSTDGHVRTPDEDEKNLKQVIQAEEGRSVNIVPKKNKNKIILEQKYATDNASVEMEQKSDVVSRRKEKKKEKSEEGSSGVSSSQNRKEIIPEEKQASNAAATEPAKILDKASKQEKKKTNRVKQQSNAVMGEQISEGARTSLKEMETNSESNTLEIPDDHALNGNSAENEFVYGNEAMDKNLPGDSETTCKRQAKETRDKGDQDEVPSAVLLKNKDKGSKEREDMKKNKAQKDIVSSIANEALRKAEGTFDPKISAGDHMVQEDVHTSFNETAMNSEGGYISRNECKEVERVVDQTRKGVYSAEDTIPSVEEREMKEEQMRDRRFKKQEKMQESEFENMYSEIANRTAEITAEEAENEPAVEKHSVVLAVEEKASEKPIATTRMKKRLEKRPDEQPSEKQEDKALKNYGKNKKQKIVLSGRGVLAVSSEEDNEDDSSDRRDEAAVARNGSRSVSSRRSSGETKDERVKRAELSSEQESAEMNRSVETKNKITNIGHGPETDSSPQPPQLSSEVPIVKKPVEIQHCREKAEFVATPGTEMLARAGDTLSLQCVLQDEHDNIEWLINGKPISSISKCSEEKEGTKRTLLIHDLTPEDTGMVVEMRLGESVSISRVVVEEQPAKMVRQLAKELTCKKGDPLTLEIEMDHEAKEVKWFKNGEPFQREGCSAEHSGPVCKLKIKATDCNDSGNYVVVADGSQSCSQVVVLDAPRFRENVELTVLVKKNDDIMLSIPFDCSTKPLLRCFKNGSPIGENVKYQVETRANEIYFCKSKAAEADAGLYSFIISNQFGEDTKVLNIGVKDVPGPPSRLTLNKIDSNTVSVNWENADCDTAEDVIGYVIERREGGRRTFHEVAKISGSETSYILDNLSMLTNYTIRVKAINRYGASEPSEISYVTGSPYTPPSIDDPPILSDVTTNGCLLTWARPTQDGGSPIYGYDVFCRKNNGNWMKMNEEIVFGERYTLRNLENDVSYEFKVEAYNEADMRSTSEVVSKPLLIPSSLNLPLTTPSVPRITVTGPDCVTLDWDSPGDEPSTKFTVAYKSEASDVWTEVHCDTNFCKVDGLKEEVSYVFKVAVENEYGTGSFSEKSAPIKILPGSPPAVLKPIRDVSVPRKRTLRLECHAGGHPTPHHLWFRNGVEIIPQDANTEIINEGSISVLIIHSVDVTDGGLYECEIENEHGTAKTTAQVAIGDVRCHFDSSFPEHNETETGRDVELCCTLSDEIGVVLWYKDGKKLEESSRISFVNEGSKRILRINSVESADNGKYRCETSDGRNSTEGELIVKAEKSHITVGPQDQIIRHCGDNVTLTCELTRPTSHIKWFKDGMEIWQQTDKYSIVTDGCCSTLQIHNFEKMDIGDYHAAVDSDEISAPARLNLETSPAIKIREILKNSVLVNAHAELDFHIEVDGHPAPTVAILHNGARIQTRALMEKYEDVIRIRMKNLTREDNGVVKITAENTIGIDQKEFTIVVVDVPSAPTDLFATNVTTSSTLLSWKAPEDTNGSPVTGFIIQRKTVDSVRWRTVGKTDATTLSFEAAGLFSSEEYLFRIMAVNSVGEGPASSHIEVLTASDTEESEEFSEALSSEVVTLEPPKTPTLKQDGDKVNLTWNAVDGATFYKLERSSDQDDWLEIAVVTKTCYVDCSIMDNAAYSYRVSAMSVNSMSNPSSGTAPVNVKERETLEPSHSSKLSSDSMDKEERAKAENEGEENATEVGVHEADEASAIKNPGKEKTREKLEDGANEALAKKNPGREKTHERLEEQRDDQEKKESTPKTTKKKQPSPVDDILDTKQRLKKRVRDGQERRPSLQQESLNTHERKYSLPGTSKNDPETTAAPKETKHEERREGTTSESTSAMNSVVDDETATNVDATASTSHAANEQGNPFTNVTSTALEVKAGEPAQICINVSRSSDAHCTWKKDGRPIKINKPFFTSYKNGVAQLIINETDASCDGLYTLTASDSQGSDVVEVDLRVKRIPHAPSGSLQVTLVDAACKLSWNAPADDGNSAIVGYVVERYDDKSKKWVFLARTTTTSFTTDKQRYGSYHRFRVAAENGIGIGPYIESEKVKIRPGTLALDLEKPVVTTEGVSVFAKWNPLPIDGVKYLVEIKEAKSRRPWTAVSSEPVEGDSFMITGLTSGEDYTVRVTAITPEVQGTPSQESEIFKYENVIENEQPSFLVAPDDVTVVKGAKMKISAEFKGYPAPEVQWFKNRKEIFSGQRLWIETVAGASSLNVGEIREDDEGDYSIMLRNAVGTCEHKFKLQMDAQPEINRPDRYTSVLVYDEGETVKLRLSFSDFIQQINL
ncbi:hypothetical protein Y032_0057g2745 [Ancylostoma ceylanicum]|uniref:Uncharacterized protein n=2 Tax=Ancylostoma ceylanicum TaxID=53326 RepID=A0A016U5G8_9BILA|nr:hypothetical protein Y032_0057g2745 [Ancylostoma ceylanicum]